MTDQEHAEAVYDAIFMAQDLITKAREVGLEVKAVASYEIVRRELCPRNFHEKSDIADDDVSF